MEGSALSILLGALATLFAGLNIFQFIFFRSTKREYEAKAEQAATEAKDAKHDYLEKRIESMEKMYSAQGEVLDNLRSQVLKLEEEKLASGKRIIQLEAENKSLTEKVERLEKEVEAYKTIRGK